MLIVCSVVLALLSLRRGRKDIAALVATTGLLIALGIISAIGQGTTFYVDLPEWRG
ncbi:MAG TPA: hypothetical protein VKE41_08495 [Roseiflexaceae bacterium]|nr:hypothetical protein [Roseiflexaceae bacterium]